jgi:hypothetical protein
LKFQRLGSRDDPGQNSPLASPCVSCKATELGTYNVRSSASPFVAIDWGRSLNLDDREQEKLRLRVTTGVARERPFPAQRPRVPSMGPNSAALEASWYMSPCVKESQAGRKSNSN